MSEKSKSKLFKISYKITIMVICLIIVSTTAIGFFSYTNYRDRSLELVSERPRYAAQYAASLVDPAQYREIMTSMEPNDYHRELSARLTEMVDGLGLFFLHIGEIDPDTGFTGFAEAQIPGFGTGLGEVGAPSQYPSEAFDAMANGETYATAPVALIDLGLGQFGDTLLGAYAPVFDENGNVIAVVSATMVDEGIYASANAFAMRIAGIVIAAIFVLIWIPIIFARRTVGKPISKLSAAANAIVHGDLSGEINVKSNDEFGILAGHFSTMQASLRKNIETERAAHQAELARGQAEAVANAMRESITYASKIQKHLLPPDTAMAAAFTDHAVIWEPRDIVGGDVYWLKQFEKGTVLCVADCTGHGTPGALLTMLVVSALDGMVWPNNCDDTAGIVWRLDQRLSDVLHVESGAEDRRSITDIDDGCDLAVLFIAKDGAVQFSSGKIPVFVCDGKEVTQYKGQKIFVGEGKLKSKDEVIVHSIPAHPGNKFYVASDGLFDQKGGEMGRQYGYKAFKQIILDNHNEKQAVITGKVWEAYEEYRGDEARRDDFELIAFQP